MLPSTVVAISESFVTATLGVSRTEFLAQNSDAQPTLGANNPGKVASYVKKAESSGQLVSYGFVNDKLTSVTITYRDSPSLREQLLVAARKVFGARFDTKVETLPAP